MSILIEVSSVGFRPRFEIGKGGVLDNDLLELDGPTDVMDALFLPRAPTISGGEVGRFALFGRVTAATDVDRPEVRLTGVITFSGVGRGGLDTFGFSGVGLDAVTTTLGSTLRSGVGLVSLFLFIGLGGDIIMAAFLSVFGSVEVTVLQDLESFGLSTDSTSSDFEDWSTERETSS
mmetsp:Transcript_29019/g.63921  ORF Transcript_29019/g.63921 Transcript_29019/m.63921 type:complete len:176 (-) Transcript_29019:697-1224(-)